MDIVYETRPLHFFIMTLCIGGGAAWMTGRAVASTWRSPYQILPYMLLLGATIRFLHYGLYDGTLLSLHFYLVDTVWLLAVSGIAFRFQRTTQMVTQYRWLYERTGPFTWRARGDASA